MGMILLRTFPKHTAKREMQSDGRREAKGMRGIRDAASYMGFGAHPFGDLEQGYVSVSSSAQRETIS